VSNFLYKYGSHTHEVGEIYDFVWQHIPHMTGRARRDTAMYRITLRGRLLCDDTCSWEDIQTKIAALSTAYSANNDLKFSVVNPDGTDSHYVLDPANDSDILKGPYLANFTYPHGSIEELVVKRDFTIVLECIRAEVESEIITYSESITHVGNCMPKWVFQNTVDGDAFEGTPRSYQVWPKTTMKIIQKGHSVGFDGYYAPGWVSGYQTIGVPVLALSFEHQEQRIEIPGKPLKLGRDFVYYPADWTYVFESAVPKFLTPA